MFICYKCGYQNFKDGKRNICPICGANNTFPIFSIILLLSLICFIIFSILSMFNDKLSIISTISIILAIISLPFAIGGALEKNNEVQEGFRAPDYPDEIINGSARVPDFKSFDYIFGLDNDEGIKKILFETYKDGLNFYHKKLQNIETIKYENITGLEIHKNKKRYILEIQIRQNENNNSIYITSEKQYLINFAKSIEYMVNNR